MIYDLWINERSQKYLALMLTDTKLPKTRLREYFQKNQFYEMKLHRNSNEGV